MSVATWLVCETLNIWVAGSNREANLIFTYLRLILILLIALYRVGFFVFSLVFAKRSFASVLQRRIKFCLMQISAKINQHEK